MSLHRSALFAVILATGTATATEAPMRTVDPASCARASTLQNRFTELTMQVDRDKAIMRNFGFEKTVADFEAQGNLPAAQLTDGMRSFRKLLFDDVMKSARAEFVDAAIAGVGNVATSGASQVADDFKKKLTPEAVAMVKALGDIPSIGTKDLASKVELANDVSSAIEVLDKAKLAYEVGSPAVKGQILELTLKLSHEIAAHGLVKLAVALPGTMATTAAAAAAWVPTLLAADEWAWHEAYKSANAVLMVHKLTQATEGDLQLLKATTTRLKNATDELKSIKSELPQLAGKCDGTQSVKRASGGGGGLGKPLVWIGLAAGAGYAATQLKTASTSGTTEKGFCDFASTKNACGSCTCISHNPAGACDEGMNNNPACGGSFCWQSSRTNTHAPFC